MSATRVHSHRRMSSGPKVICEAEVLRIQPPAGRLELDDMTRIYREFQLHLRGDPRRLVIDFQAVERLAAGYAAMLLRMKKTAESQGIRLVLRNIPPQLRAIFRIYKLDHVFEIEETRRG